MPIDTTPLPVSPLPACCDCGWVFPAAFQLLAPTWAGRETDPPLPTGVVLLFACGNCGAWRPVTLGKRGGACTANAAGFANMPEKCR
jgi:hypothetical protein